MISTKCAYDLMQVKYELLRNLLSASNADNSEVVQSLLDSVAITLQTKLCSLWKISRENDSLSLVCRKGWKPENIVESDYKHSLSNSLIEHCVEALSKQHKPYLEIPDVTKTEYWSRHQGKGRVEELGLKRMISIPIPDQYSDPENRVTIAALNLYLPDDYPFDDELAQFIGEHFSLTMSRSKLITRECLTSQIVEIYEKRASKDLSSVLHPIITSTLKSFIEYEGCSVFVLDPFYNRYALTQTTGLKEKVRKSEVYYSIDEGLTGYAAKTGKPVIISDLSNIPDELKVAHKSRFSEDTDLPHRSFLAIPIKSPSRPDEVLGVIRFVNRLNTNSGTLDDFDEEDISLIRHACNLIGLYMEYEQSERIRTAFAMQMAHEMHTPSVSIQGASERLLRNWEYGPFRTRYMERYLTDILEQSKLQITLSRTVEYIWKGASDTAKSKVYQVEETDFLNVVRSSKRLVIPIARGARLHFDNIMIRGNFPNLQFDRYALEQVIFNLLTNAIKYREPRDPSEFQVKVLLEGKSSVDIPSFVCPIISNGAENSRQTTRKTGYRIRILDHGIGIRELEKEKIFLLGYRREGIEKTQVRGLGMGLCVARKIMNDFGCYIWVSKSMEPTEFSLFFPDHLENSEFLRSEDWTNV